MNRWPLLLVTAGFALGICLPQPAPAEEKGAALLEERCSICHPAARPKSKQKTVAEWEATVTRMMGKGAKLTMEEKQVLVDYLGRTYKP